MRNRPATRRQFLKRSTFAAGGLFLAAPVGASRLAMAAETSRTAANVITGKDPRLIVHSAEPAELETPLALLREHSITPDALLFVRNNQSLSGAMNLLPLEAGGWPVEITGLVERPGSINVSQLSQMQQIEQELVLQCSGNGRAMFSAAAPAKGAQWQCGAMGNVRFGGVPLVKVLDRLGLKIDPRARFVTAEGRDAPAKAGDPDFEHSIPLEDALSRSFVALTMNGAPIPAAHGGPVRLVTPGYYATMNVKWLGRLRFEETETANYHQVRRYRTPREPIPVGSEFTYGLQNSEPNWRMRTKSVIFAPLEGERVAAGDVDIRGVAWNDGATPIETVLVSTGNDMAWRPARIVTAGGPYAWQHWSLSLDLQPGEYRLSARAVDALGRTQPLSPAAHWNPAGYAFNGVHSVKVIVR